MALPPPSGPLMVLGSAAADGRHEIRVFGNTQGLKASQVRQLERLFRRRLPPERLLTQEFARTLTEITHETGRQVGVLVDRRGVVTHVMVGDSRSIELPDWGRIRAGPGRLRGFRCIHAHLGDEALTRDDLTDLAVLHLDAMVVVTTDSEGMPGRAHVAALRAANQEGATVQHLPPVSPSQLDFDFQAWIRDLEEELARSARTRAVGDGERAVLVSVTAGRRPTGGETSVEELKELARSAGVVVTDVVTQHRPNVDPKTLIGEGKLQDLVVRAFQQDVDLVIFDQNLTPTQARNLGERMELRVIDRTQLILDIFAQRATSRDGKLQVELAQLKYRLPRLAQQDASLSRLGAGIGGRGPGETKLELDRRRVRDRISRLERELRNLRREREGRRRRRQRRGVPVLSIVGYTNAGKSTLLRALTRTEVLVEDKMFATLDPTSRRLRFPREREVLVTDTVGFIRDLPGELVAAFRATLEELESADLFLHVVDAAAPDLERRLAAVRRVLGEIGLGDTPELLVFNQVDRLPAAEGTALARRYRAVPVSALHSIGLELLLDRVAEILWESEVSEAPRGSLAFAAEGGRG
ncbi:MAG TPA: GTPase HflX [Myxococcota bacterium]|nr:GTPase HflX [Myxococcota bacterium]